MLLTFGGQTALNCGVQLQRAGVFEKYNVKILGTPIQSIIETEDRKLFADKINEIGEMVAPSSAVYSVQEVSCMVFFTSCNYVMIAPKCLLSSTSILICYSVFGLSFDTLLLFLSVF